MWYSSQVSAARHCSYCSSASTRLPCCGDPVPSKLRTTSSPISTALKRAREEKMSCKCSSVRCERWHLALGGRGLRAVLELGANLAGRKLHSRAVTEPGRDPWFHGWPPAWAGGP